MVLLYTACANAVCFLSRVILELLLFPHGHISFPILIDCLYPRSHKTAPQWLRGAPKLVEVAFRVSQCPHSPTVLTVGWNLMSHFSLLGVKHLRILQDTKIIQSFPLPFPSLEGESYVERRNKSLNEPRLNKDYTKRGCPRLRSSFGCNEKEWIHVTRGYWRGPNDYDSV